MTVPCPICGGDMHESDDTCSERCADEAWRDDDEAEALIAAIKGGPFLRNSQQDAEATRLLREYDQIVAKLTDLGVDVTKVRP